MNGRARAEIEHGDFGARATRPVRQFEINMTGRRMRKKTHDTQDQRGQGPVGVVEDEGEPRSNAGGEEREQTDGDDKECDRHHREIGEERRRRDEVEIGQNERQTIRARRPAKRMRRAPLFANSLGQIASMD